MTVVSMEMASSLRVDFSLSGLFVFFFLSFFMFVDVVRN